VRARMTKVLSNMTSTAMGIAALAEGEHGDR
jgi:hypothetical protein